MRVRSSYGVGALVGVVSVAWGTLPVPASAEPPVWTCQAQVATIVGTAGDDILTGTDGDDVVWLLSGIDTFHGGKGNDVVCGGPGRDSIYGEEGDDQLYGDDGSDYNIVGGPGDDVIHGGTGDEFNLHGDDFHQDGGSDEVYGDGGADTIHGEPGAGVDLYDGGPDADRISFYLSGGGVTIDVPEGTATGDAVDQVVGMEMYQGSEFADVLIGSADDDSLDGLSGRDEVLGQDGDDTLTASSGRVTAGRGYDTFVARDEGTHGLTVRLGKGSDRAVLDASRHTTVLGGPGMDIFEVPAPGFGTDAGRAVATLDGGASFDRLTFAHHPQAVRIDVRARTATWSQGTLTFAHLEEYVGSQRGDLLLGTRHPDRLYGGDGNDVLKGRGGDDLLTGDDGRDSAYGGPGHDICSAERRFSCEQGHRS